MSNLAQIKQITINNFVVDFNLKQSQKLNMEIRLEATINPPKDIDDKTALLVFKVELYEVDDNDLLLQAVANIIFEFDEIPKDYKNIAVDVCIPMAQEEVLHRIDEILAKLGHLDLKLSESNKKND